MRLRERKQQKGAWLGSDRRKVRRRLSALGRAAQQHPRQQLCCLKTALLGAVCCSSSVSWVTLEHGMGLQAVHTRVGLSYPYRGPASLADVSMLSKWPCINYFTAQVHTVHFPLLLTMPKQRSQPRDT